MFEKTAMQSRRGMQMGGWDCEWWTVWKGGGGADYLLPPTGLMGLRSCVEFEQKDSTKYTHNLICTEDAGRA